MLWVLGRQRGKIGGQVLWTECVPLKSTWRIPNSQGDGIWLVV